MSNIQNCSGLGICVKYNKYGFRCSLELSRMLSMLRYRKTKGLFNVAQKITVPKFQRFRIPLVDLFFTQKKQCDLCKSIAGFFNLVCSLLSQSWSWLVDVSRCSYFNCSHEISLFFFFLRVGYIVGGMLFNLHHFSKKYYGKYIPVNISTIILYA